MEAQLGSCSSYTRRSFIAGKDALNKGLLWSVGNGNLRYGRISGFHLDEQRVSNLIDWDRQCWDEPLIRSLMFPYDAELILKMPIFTPQSGDERIWYHTKDGVFTIRSSYHLILQQRFAKKEPTSRESSSSFSMDSLWKKLWTIDTLPKIKSFMWSACRNLLLVKENLRNRRITSDSFCDVCGNVESGFHALFSCFKAQDFWILVPDLAWVGYKAQSVMECLEHGVHFFSSEQLIQWAGLMWGTWNSRNKQIFENECLEPWEVVKHSKDLCTDFSTSRLQLRLKIRSPAAECVWKKPKSGWLKLNCDASFTEDVEYGIGFVIRDSSGTAVLLGSCGIGNVPDKYAEAEAIRKVLQYAVDRGLNRMVVELDCLPLISKLRLRRVWKGPMGLQLEAIRMLGARIGEIRWTYTKRDENRVAHTLARLRSSPSLITSVVSCFSSVVENLVLADLH
ncbi:hypothetical protein V2J09_013902 [Rumex salicifolius]